MHVGSLFNRANAKYVVLCPWNEVIVVNTLGELWAHDLSLGGKVAPGRKLNGHSIFGGANDKYLALHGDLRLLVINKAGEVWAHDFADSMSSNPLFNVPPWRSIGDGYTLVSPSIFGAPNDKYVTVAGNHLLVINTLGEVWCRELTATAMQGAFRLKGPGLFGGADDKYVVAYQVAVPPR